MALITFGRTKEKFVKILISCFFFLSTCNSFASSLQVINGLKYFIDTETNEATLIAYNYSGVINVPENVIYNGKEYPIVAFDADCFNGCQELKKVKIPSTVKKLGDNCFHYTSLTEIEIPNSVTHLGESCFSVSRNLEKVVLSNSLTEISKDCFNSCWSLKNVEIPSSVTKLGEMCFCGTAIENIIIPSSITIISNGCFYNCLSLKSINIPKTVKYIGEYCFEYNDSLVSITIPESIENLPKRCFSACHNLEEIKIPNSIKSFGDECFAGCENLMSFTIPESVKSLGASCFSGCISLLALRSLAKTPPTIHETTFNNLSKCVLYVPEEAIEKYKNTPSWNFFKSIVPLDNEKLSGFITIDNLKFLYDSTKQTASLVRNNYTGKIIVPENILVNNNKYTVTSFDDNCFSNCEYLTSISIPNTVKTLGENCFSECN